METQKYTKLNQNQKNVHNFTFDNDKCNIWNTVQLLAEAQEHLGAINSRLKKRTNIELLNKKDEIEHILNNVYSNLLNVQYL